MKKTALLACLWMAVSLHAADRPNVVLIMTDDQGYGDLGHTGNPVIKTPNIDKLASESWDFTDYHVAPTCSPTRCALMTGHWTNRTGVWHTVNGRSMLRENEITIARMLRDAGYATGMFGKWHLGDNYPYRAEDRGFTEVFRHGGGGVGQTPDVWDNAYFDGSYFHNSKIVPAKGFCTDVFFREAKRFIGEQVKAGKPFFAYIAPNAPHGPLHAPQKYLDMYKDQQAGIAAFFAMITNIDDNVGALREWLKELGVEKNTVFIFSTDNGTATGAKVFNAEMRGAKGSEYEGGHRVPLFVHWPAAGWTRHQSEPILAHAVDIAPTLLEITGATKPASVQFDGRSLMPLFQGKRQSWEDRYLITDSQRVRDPIKWRKSSVMSGTWRLINGKELYDISKDPGQKQDLSAKEPARVAAMRAFYESWWAELYPTFSQTTEIPLGHARHPKVILTGHDWIQEDLPPWNQAHIRDAYPVKAGRGKPPETRHTGHWAVKVLTAGRYQISVRRWPVEADQPINAMLEPGAQVPGASQAYRARQGQPIRATQATLRLNGQDLLTKPVEEGDHSVTFTITLNPGSYQLAPYFHVPTGELGAYYAEVNFQP